MLKSICVIAALLATSFAYDRNAAVGYAGQWWNSANHQCGTYTSCTPYSYWGSESCGYGTHGGDCANFVSQCLIAGGHPYLTGGEPCRGYPCGKEEVCAKSLGDCLVSRFGWSRTCGYLAAPPSNIQPGDVLIYHADSCSSYTAHATLVVSTSGAVTIACHSTNHYGMGYNYLSDSKPYFEWLHLD